MNALTSGSTAGTPDAEPLRARVDFVGVPIYEFKCEECGTGFEELVAAGTSSAACPECGSERTRRLISAVSPPGRTPRGAGVRSDESRRREKVAARENRIAESRKRRAAGDKP
jgi:putative FmdB family regulatory protein